MNAHAVSPSRWITASFAATGDTVANDLSALGAHFHNCNGCKGRWFSIRCAVDAVHSFVAPRFVTTLVAVGVVVAIAAVAM